MMPSCTPAFASTSNEEVVFEAKEIENWKDIKKRMENGITDDLAIKIRGTISDEIYTDEKGRRFKAVISDEKITSQKIKTVKTKEGKIINSYVANALIEARLEPIGNIKSIEEDYDGHDYTYHTLGTAHVTLYYEMEPNVQLEGLNVNMFRPQYAKGKVQRVSSQVVFDYIKVRIKAFGDYYSDCQGENYEGCGGKADEEYDSKPNVESYYTINANNTNYWWPIYPGSQSCFLEGQTLSGFHYALLFSVSLIIVGYLGTKKYLSLIYPKAVKILPIFALGLLLAAPSLTYALQKTYLSCSEGIKALEYFPDESSYEYVQIDDNNVYLTHNIKLKNHSKTQVRFSLVLELPEVLYSLKEYEVNNLSLKPNETRTFYFVRHVTVDSDNSVGKGYSSKPEIICIQQQ